MKLNHKSLFLAITLVMILAFILSACQAAATATPTSSPPTPTKAPAAATAAVPAPAAATPTSAAAAAATATKPAATPVAAAPKPTGKLVFAAESEPDTMDPKDATLTPTQQVIRSIYDTMTWRDKKTMATAPLLAESWKQIEPTKWQFKLKAGVKFTNGEPFNAQAVAFAVERMLYPNAQYIRYFEGLQPAQVVDDTTINIITKNPDPIVPDRMYFLMVPAPKWAKENAEEIPIKAIGTGSYKLKEWNKGQYVKLETNPDYWGPTKPTIGEVTLLPRKEPSVRAAMCRTGEAQICYNITTEDSKNAPKALKQETVEVVVVRFNTISSPVFKDAKVREAVNLATDRQTLVDKLYSGFASPAAQWVQPSATGFNPNIKPKAFDMAKAKSLVAEAKAAGVPVTQAMNMIIRTGWFQKDREMGEAISNWFVEAGLTGVKPKFMEAAEWRAQLYAVTPDDIAQQKTPAIIMTAHGNELMDSAVSLDSYARCGGRLSSTCMKELDLILDKANAASGADRVKLFNDAWKMSYDNNLLDPVLSISFLHSITKNVEWEPRLDSFVFFNDIKLLP